MGNNAPKSGKNSGILAKNGTGPIFNNQPGSFYFNLI